MRLLFAAFCIAALARGMIAGTCDWTAMAGSDTLTVYLGETATGSLVHGFSVNQRPDLLGEYTRLAIDPPPSVRGLDAMTLYEARHYDTLGALLYAHQELAASSGTTTWELRETSADSMALSVDAGGMKQEKRIGRVRDNCAVTCAIYNAIMRGSPAAGSTWVDTQFELTSGRPLVMTTRLVETPAARNGDHWVFMNSDDVSKQALRWEVDTAGRTVVEEIPPGFTARAKGLLPAHLPGSAPAMVDIADIAKVPASRSAGRHENILVTVDSIMGDVDTSVAGWYVRKGNGWLLIPPSSRCARIPADNAPALKSYIRPTPTLQSSHPDIVALSRRLAGDRTDACRMIKAANAHVYSSLVKRNTAAFSSALETLRAGYGDCGEHAVLLAALLRAAGIPARVVYGLVYVESRRGYCYHAWVMAWAGSWIWADPALGVFPAFRDRVPLLIDDTGERLVALAGYMRRISISYAR
jgi:transglutaminase-like putative cysteine protease